LRQPGVGDPAVRLAAEAGVAQRGAVVDILRESLADLKAITAAKLPINESVLLTARGQLGPTNTAPFVEQHFALAHRALR
jgi:hypothetical protein